MSSVNVSKVTSSLFFFFMPIKMGALSPQKMPQNKTAASPTARTPLMEKRKVRCFKNNLRGHNAGI